jgi:hypothetical protein
MRQSVGKVQRNIWSWLAAQAIGQLTCDCASLLPALSNLQPVVIYQSFILYGKLRRRRQLWIKQVRRPLP